MRARTRRLPLAPLTLLMLASLLVACAGGDDNGSASGPATSTPATGETFPVSVEHKYGTTEIPAAPERVVTVGLSDHEPVIALGVVPVGVDDWFGERPFGIWPWVEDRWTAGEPTVIGERDDFNFERIAALKPDLIIGLYSGLTEDDYETMSAIAPTVAQPLGYDDYAAPWQVMTRLAGQALGKDAEAESLVADVEQQFADVRAAHPEFDGQTVAVVDPYEPGQYAVFAPHDPKVVFMTELGFVVPDAIVDAVGSDYAAEISSERLDLVDVDRLLFLTGSTDAEATVNGDAVYSSLAVAREGRALFLPYDIPPIGGALSFSTVLSIPWALEQVVPLLAGTASS